MVLPTKSLAPRLTLGACALILTLLLVACSSGNTTDSSKGSASPVARGNTSSSASGATATAHALTPVATTNAVMKTYNGGGFTISYPENWKAISSTNGVAFSDPSGNYNMSVGTTPNADGSVNPEQLVNGGITGAKANLKSVQSIAVPTTMSFAGQTWTQRAVSGMNTYQGQPTTIEANILATNYPSHTSGTKGYIIAYVALENKFALARSMYFTQMLQSFKFTL